MGSERPEEGRREGREKRGDQTSVVISWAGTSAV